MTYQIEVTRRGAGTSSAELERIKIAATPGHVLLRFGDEPGADIKVEVALPADVAARFAESLAAAVGTQAAAKLGGA